ncbi:MAG: aminoacyl-tRNA hydrolase [Candidatus Uhrbacteria bacterium]
MTFLIVGLGNPGKEYEKTRHNIGREIVDAISRNDECLTSSAEWRQKRLLHAEILENTHADQRVILAKPTTYMNESGTTVSALVHHVSRLTSHVSRLLVLHDDLDLPVGTLRLSMGGSSGGHKGIQSIINALGADDFLRLRIGIGPNAASDGHRIPAEKFVLEKFRKEERPLIDAAIQRAVKVIEMLLRDGLPAAQQFAN